MPDRPQDGSSKDGKETVATTQPPPVLPPPIAEVPPPSTPSITHRIYTSDSEDHYKNLVDYFKSIVWASTTVLGIVTVILGGIGAFSLWLNYKSIADVKTEMKQSIADVRADAKSAVDNAKDGAQQAITNAQSGAQSAISSASDQAAFEISKVRQQSAGIALGEAQKRVDDAFRTTNVTEMVESAARRQVGPVIERQVRGEVDRVMAALQEDISSLGEISDAGSYMRGGGRPGLEKLLALQKSSNDRVRERAKVILEAIANDYERVFTRQVSDGDGKNALKDMYGEKAIAQKGSPTIIGELVKTIRTEQDLGSVALAFLALRVATGYPFKMFDIEAVEQWCAGHQAQCK